MLSTSIQNTGSGLSKINIGNGMGNILITLFASIQAKYVDIDTLNFLAARMRKKLSGAGYWLEQLEFCQVLDCAEIAIREELINLGIDVSNTLPRLLVGFLYLRLEKGELSLQEFEGELIDVVDAYEIAGLEIEQVSVALQNLASDFDFQKLLNEMAQESLDNFRLVEALAD